MKPINQIQIENALREGCRTYVFSGCQLAFATGAIEKSFSFGQASYWKGSRPVEEDTYFDLGSLTKVVFTTSVFARLVEQKRVDVNTPVEDFIPAFKKTRYSTITLKQLLTHSSGLVSWNAFYLEKTTDLIEVFLKNERSFLPERSEVNCVYSDLGFLLLGEVLRLVFGDFKSLFQTEVMSPLRLKEIKFGPLPPEKCAATEFCLERRKLLQGQVFDHNTDFLGGVCSHAGLFSSAKSLLPWAKEWLKAVQGASSWLSPEVAREFIRGGQEIGDSTWALGWDTKSKAFSSAGDFFSNESFGHLGFPGTSIWIDPINSGVVVLLTNRVHPSRLDERIKRFRPMIHNLIAESWESHGS